MKRGFIRLNMLLALALLVLSSAVTLGQDRELQLDPGPVQISPVSPATFMVHNITFEWQPDAREASAVVWYNVAFGVAGSGSYTSVWVSSAETDPLSQFYITKVNGKNTITRTVTNNGNMVWSIRASVNNVYTEWSTANFTINFVPSGMINNASDPAARGDVTFTWNYSTRATWYHVVIGIPASLSGTGTFVSRVDDWYLVNGPDNRLKCFDGTCRVQPKALPNGTYEWYLQAWGPVAFLSPIVGPQQFTINLAPPDANQFVSSGFYAFATSTVDDGDRPVFVFNDIDRASWYHLVVLQNGTTIISQWFRRSTLTCNIEDGVNKCQVYPSKGLQNGTFAWSMRAWGPGGMSVNGSNGSGYSTGSTLNLANPSIASLTPKPLSPNTTINDQSQVIFKWEAIQGATWWRLLIQKQTNTGWETVFDGWRHFANTGACPLTVCTWANPITLTNGNYRWWVNAWGPIGEKTLWPVETPFSVNIP